MKKRNRIIYANEGIFAGPAFRDEQAYAENLHSPNLSKIQSIAYSVGINRQQFNTLGKSSPASNQHAEHPEVIFDITYNSASATNEKLIGLTYDSVENSFIKNIIDETDIDNYRKNFYVVSAKEGTDFVSGELTDMESVLFFSDCALKSYGYEIAINQFPTATASFVGENMGYFQAPEKSEDVVIYTSDFNAGTDGWTMGGQTHFEYHEGGGPGSPSGPGSLHVQATEAASGHYIARIMLTVGKKYKVSGKVYINSSSPNLDTVRVFADPAAYIPLHIITDHDQWVSFETEFTAADDVLSFWGWVGNDFEWVGAGSSPFDAFYIADIVVTEIPPPDPLEIYVSDFSSSAAPNDGWGTASSAFDYPETIGGKDNAVKITATTVSSAHYAHRPDTLTADKKYKLSGKAYINSASTNIDHVRATDAATEITRITTKGSWVSFSKEFTVSSSPSSQSLFFSMYNSVGSQNWAGDTSKDIFYLKNIAVTELPFQNLKIPILNKKTGFEESYAEVTIPQGKKVDERVLTPNEASISITKASDSAENNSPDKIRGLSMWLTADSLAGTHAHGEAVNEWKDKTGNVTFDTGGGLLGSNNFRNNSNITGFPEYTVQFTNAESMASNSTLADIISSKGYTVFVLQYLGSSFVVENNCGGGSSLGAGTSWGNFLRKSSGGVYYEQFLHDSPTYGCPTVSTSPDNILFSVSSFDNSSLEICQRALGPNQNTIGACNVDSTELPGRTDDLTETLSLANGGYAGYIAEIIVYRRNLSESEKEKVERYLFDKFSLDTLNWSPTYGTETRLQHFGTKTSIVNFKNDKLEALKFDLNLERVSENIVGHKIPLNKQIKFPVNVESNLTLKADNTEEETLINFLSTDEKYNISTTFIRSAEDLDGYVSNFGNAVGQNDTDGWSAYGGAISDGQGQSYPYLQYDANTSQDYHQIYSDDVLTPGKKYRLTGNVWLDSYSNNFEKLQVLTSPEITSTEIVEIFSLTDPGGWVSFSEEFVASDSQIRVRGLAENDAAFFTTSTQDNIYIQEFKVVEIERKEEVLNVKFENALLKSSSVSSEIGSNKTININLATNEKDFGFSGVYTS